MKKNVDFHYSETLRALRKVQFCRQTKASLYILLIHSLLLLLLLFSLEDQRIFIFFFFFCFNSRSHTDVAVFYYFWLTINCIKLFFCFCLNPQKKALLFCIAHTLDTINVFVHNGRQHRMNTFSVMIKKKISEKHFFFSSVFCLFVGVGGESIVLRPTRNAYDRWMRQKSYYEQDYARENAVDE